MYRAVRLKGRFTAFTDIVPVPGGNLDYDVALNDGLAAQSRVQLDVRRGFNAVCFVIIHLGELALAILDDYVAGRAGTISTAGMFQVKPEVHCDVEQRLRFAMLAVWDFAVLELERVTGGKKRNSWHSEDYTGAVNLALALPLGPRRGLRNGRETCER